MSQFQKVPVSQRAYAVNEFCIKFRLGRTTVYKLINNGTLASVRIGGRRLIPADAAEALITITEQK